MSRAAAEAPHVTVVTARCSLPAGQLFGIRLERTSRASWVATWAFALKPQVAKREGYDRQSAEGEIGLAADYPGCPSCGSTGLAACGRCGNASCWNGESSMHRCPWCGGHAQVEGPIVQLRVRGDR